MFDGCYVDEEHRMYELLGRWSISGEVIGPRPVLPAVLIHVAMLTRELFPTAITRRPQSTTNAESRCLKIIFSSCALMDRKREKKKENQVIALCSEIEYWFIFRKCSSSSLYIEDEIVNNRSSSLIILGININSTTSWLSHFVNMRL